MFKINLVPEVQEKKNQAQKMNTLSVAVAVVVMGVVVVALILISLARATINFQLANTERKIAEVKKESEQYKELEETVVSLEKGLAAVKEIYDGKNQWIPFLTHLEAATPAEVTYKTLKIEESAVEATVEAGSVDGLAKMIDSYKNYQVLTITGSGEPTKDLAVTVDGAQVLTVRVKSTGVWVTSVKVDLSKNHEVKVGSGEQFATITYTADGQKIEGTDGASGVLKYLFTAVDAKEYQRAENKITSTVKFTFDGSAIW